MVVRDKCVVVFVTRHVIAAKEGAACGAIELSSPLSFSTNLNLTAVFAGISLAQLKMTSVKDVKHQPNAN